ncbi:DUF6734 family protein [Microcystis sp. LEGE 08355]|uniref:DUF6734 family protein n=1 Tax=Microcystis sp. LEGE 08355 TaxID=1828687 RepID=UPI00351C9608
MRAVWTFWTKPMKASASWPWLSSKHHLLGWILSVETAKKHYSKTSLFTDDEGAKLLIDGLGLEFDYVSKELNYLDEYDPGWWALGKLYAYRAQQEPFTHIDSDAFLWKPLPERMLTAPLLAQNPDYFIVGQSEFYRPDKFEALLKRVKEGWLPEEWIWCRKVFVNHQKGVGCGIFGGNRVDFINYYADLAIKVISHPANDLAVSGTNEKARFVILFEQFLLAACIDYHKNRSDSPYQNLDIQYLFDFLEDCFLSADKAGYTHLIGKSKSSKDVGNRLEERVKKDYPELYERCLNLVYKNTELVF